MKLVCPSCGSGEFTQTRTSRTEFKLTFDSDCLWTEISEECVDSGDFGDEDIACDDCGEQAVEDELVTEDAYNDDDWTPLSWN